MTQSQSSASRLPGASIAVFKDGAVLLVKRGRAPKEGMWSLPGGKVEPGGETAPMAALRELKEETGIEAELAGTLGHVEIDAEGSGAVPLRYRLTVFYGRYVAGTARPGGDAEAAEWVALPQLAEREMTEGTAALIAQAAQRLQGAPSG
jgi:8-oxo-dGTP diphosphatase